MLTSTDVSGKMFRVALRGYSEDEVDVFLDRIAKTLWEREAGRRGELTPRDIDQQTFMVALRGYAEEEVDQFLDEVVQTLRNSENREVEELTPPVSVPAVTQEGPGPPAVQPEAAVPVPPEPTQPAAAEPPMKKPPSTAEPAPTVTRLIVTRPNETRGRPYTVLLDDKPLGKISPGATQRFEIPTGTHWVTVKTRKEQSNTQVIEPQEGDQITLSCGPASGEIDDLGRKMEGIILELVG